MPRIKDKHMEGDLKKLRYNIDDIDLTQGRILYYLFGSTGIPGFRQTESQELSALAVDDDKINGETNWYKYNQVQKFEMSTDEDPADKEITIIAGNPNPLLYNVNDRPPIYLTLLFAFQQTLLSLSGSIAVSFLVADVACAEKDDEIKTKLLSSTLFMNGVSTFVMVLIGVRLPLFQGAAGDYVVPLLAMMTVDPNKCTRQRQMVMEKYMSQNNASFVGSITNGTFSGLYEREVILTNLRVFEGCLILAGVVHCLVGATGLVGVLLRFIGPITIVPTILLSGIYIVRATTKFSKAHWGVSALTAATAIILSLYLGHKKAPVPSWSRKKGFHIIWYPVHQVFSLLIGILVGWLVSGILTVCGALSDDPSSPEFFARTDARGKIIEDSSWLYFPYPGQFGAPSFNVAVFVAFLIATITSILDSIGDYYACSKMCNVPPPPSHAANRGIAAEGFCSAISGAIGCGCATTTYGGNIGAIGVTKVASRDVFIGVAIIYILFGIVGKFSAVFVTIPLSVLGGSMIVMFGMFNGVVLSNLQGVSLSSTRNLAIMGTALLLGLMVPHWVETTPDGISTGDPGVDNVLKMLLANPNLTGGFFACFMDNTIPGTKEERGISAWQNIASGNEDEETKTVYSLGIDTYLPLIPKRFLTTKLAKYIPFCPYLPEKIEKGRNENNADKTS